MQVEEFLEHSARAFPDKLALIVGGRRLTYSQVDAQCNRLAAAFIGAGISRGDRVVIYLDNSVETVVAIFAALKAGAIFVVINPSTKADKLSYILNNCRAVTLVTHSRKLESIQECLRDGPHLESVFLAGAGELVQRDQAKRFISIDDVLQPDKPLPALLPKQCIDMDLAALVYTSGSTGRPKGVMLTNLNIVSAATSITTYLGNTPDDIILNTLPLSFDYGLYQVLMAFKFGGTVIVETSFTYPAAVLSLMAREKVTGFPLVPTISAILLQLDLKKWDLSRLRYISNTGAALPTEHILKLRQLLPHVQIFSMYGLTECKRVSYLPPEQIDIRPTSIGKGMPNEEVYIVDDHGRRVGPGEVGELVIRGSNVMPGYWELPEETDKMLRPGPYPWEKVLYSGDLFRKDEEGYLYFIGRKDDIIKSRGEKVSPREVEDVLYSLRGVAEAAVIGVPDKLFGSAIMAVIVPQPGVRLTQDQVLRHCTENLEDYMVPKFVEFREQMPRTSTGKIAKRELLPSGAAS